MTTMTSGNNSSNVSPFHSYIVQIDESKGYNVQSAQTAHEAISLAEQHAIRLQKPMRVLDTRIGIISRISFQ